MSRGEMQPSESFNPYNSPTLAKPLPAAPAAPLVGATVEKLEKALNSAKWTLVIIGLLTIALNVFRLFGVESEMAAVLAEEPPEAGVDPEIYRTFLLVFGYGIYGCAAILGLVFVALGLMVRWFPLFCTITSLILYVLATVLFGLLDPSSLAQGIIFKVFVVIALFSAVRTILTARKEMRAAQLAL